MLTVRDVMATKLLTVRGDTDILDAVEFLLEHEISGAPVVSEDGGLIGVISEKDCLKLVAEGVGGDVPRGPVSAFMTQDVETIPPGMDIYYAAGLFLRNSFRRFPVVEDGKLVGQVSRRDLLRVVEGLLRQS